MLVGRAPRVRGLRRRLPAGPSAAPWDALLQPAWKPPRPPTVGGTCAFGKGDTKAYGLWWFRNVPVSEPLQVLKNYENTLLPCVCTVSTFSVRNLN